MRNVAGIILCSLVIVMLASCKSVPVLPEVTAVTPDQVGLAKQKAGLETVYQQLKTDLRGVSKEGYPKEFQMLNEVKSRLANVYFAEAMALLDAAKKDTDTIPVPRLQEISAKAANIKELSPTRFAEINATIAAEQNKTDGQIASLSEQLGALSEDGLREKLTILKELFSLSGKPEYKTERDGLVNTILAQVSDAENTEKLDEGLAERLSILRAEQPDNKEIRDKLAVVNGKLFENKFFAALANDRPLRAYEHFLTLTTADDFAQIRPHLRETGKTMADYFTALGSDATYAGDLRKAYEWYVRSKNVETNLQLESDGVSTNSYVEKIVRSYQAAMDAREFELALGLLAVVKEFSPQHSLLRTETRSTEKKVLQRALVQVTISAFDNSAGARDFGSNVSAKINQHLFSQLPKDVRIIERQEYDNIVRERELNQEGGQDREGLVSADYFILGNVLEAKVDSQEQQGKKTIRVTTGQQNIKNPEFATWQALPERNRKQIEQPPAMIVEDTIEDVSINVTNHRKIGVFSVSYRLVDAKSGNVVLPNTATFTEEYTDTSSEGVQLGDFSLPFKLAELPSELEILGSLAIKAAETVGEQLTEKLKNPEVRYKADAIRSASEQNHYDATKNFAKALALTKHKGQPTDDLVTLLKESATHAVVPK